MEAKPDFKIHVVIVSHDPGLWVRRDAGVDRRARPPAGGRDSGGYRQRGRPHRQGAALLAHGLCPLSGTQTPDSGPRPTRCCWTRARFPISLCFCHDDVALAPDTLRLLVHEAVRSNAGIVGPKYVDWDDPTRIRQIGLLVDKTGVPAPTVEIGELDQEQHDVVQDMFAVPGGCVLVRGDLFRAIGGFDPEMSFCYEHVDLCWRARTVGARVLVAPAATVRHRQRLAERIPRPQIDGLWRRHRVRTLLSVYGTWHSVRVIPQAVLLSAIELLAALVTGHLSQARQIGASWGHHLIRLGSIRRRRQAVSRARHVGDAHIRLSQVRGIPSLASFLTGRGSGAGDGPAGTGFPVGPVEPLARLGGCGSRHGDLGHPRGPRSDRRRHPRGRRSAPAGFEL